MKAFFSEAWSKKHFLFFTFFIFAIVQISGCAKIDSLKKSIRSRTLPLSLEKIVKKNGTIFEFQSCELNDRTVRCHVLITSQFRDREIDMRVRAHRPNVGIKIFDNAGNKYDGALVQVGTEKGSSRNATVRAMLVADVPTKSIYQFDNISSQASSISMLMLNGRLKVSGEREQNKYTVKYRNISFEGQPSN